MEKLYDRIAIDNDLVIFFLKYCFFFKDPICLYIIVDNGAGFLKTQASPNPICGKVWSFCMTTALCWGGGGGGVLLVRLRRHRTYVLLPDIDQSMHSLLKLTTRSIQWS